MTWHYRPPVLFPPKPCATCGRLFKVADHPKQIYCSWECRWPKRSAAERLWTRVERSAGCWEFGARQPYAQIDTPDGPVGVHRLAWELTYGPIPEGLYVCHHCDNPRCVRPDHLFLGTNRDNQLDARAKGRLPLGERNARAKLTNRQVREIKARLAGGEGPTYLAAIYAVSRPTIQAIKSGRNWRSVQ